MNFNDMCIKKVEDAGYLKQSDAKEIYHEIIYEIINTYTKEKLVQLINSYCEECSQNVKRRNCYKRIVRNNEISVVEFNRIQDLIIKMINDKYNKEV